MNYSYTSKVDFSDLNDPNTTNMLDLSEYVNKNHNSTYDNDDNNDSYTYDCFESLEHNLISLLTLIQRSNSTTSIITSCN